MRNLVRAAGVSLLFLLTSGELGQAGTIGDPQQMPVASQQLVYQPGVGYVRPEAVGVPMSRPDIGAMPRPVAVARRSALGGGFLEAVLGPSSGPSPAPTAVAYNGPMTPSDPYATADYAVRPTKAVDPMYQRQEVDFTGRQPAGTIVIDTQNKFLYLVEAPGRALRYGIGVGRPGFVWVGTKTITRKAEWPGWTPPPEMIKRRPDLPSHMVGGIANPLGARAMYLGSTLYRIHGTNEPDTIGTNVSSGCIRLTNEDVSDLYGRVKVGTRVVVL